MSIDEKDNDNTILNSKTIRLICISDTHNGHKSLTNKLKSLYESENDILIHAGDITDRGSKSELSKFNTWLGSMPYKYKIVISGNMDGFGLDYNKNKINGKQLLNNAIYLEHEIHIIKELNNLSLFGSPYTPKFVGGFQLNNDNESKKIFSTIPPVDVLITHGPPYGILDRTSRNIHVGDKYLLNTVINNVKPKVMVYGHVHESYGITQQNNITFINAAQHNGIHLKRKTVQPIVFTLNK